MNKNTKWKMIVTTLILAFTLLPALQMTASAGDAGCETGYFHWWDDGRLYRWKGTWTLRRGSRGEAVQELQRELQWHGYSWVDDDGDFGPITQDAVRRFQREYRDAGITACGRTVTVDGVAGPQTFGILHND